jgi:hypothetical protein
LGPKTPFLHIFFRNGLHRYRHNGRPDRLEAPRRGVHALGDGRSAARRSRQVGEEGVSKSRPAFQTRWIFWLRRERRRSEIGTRTLTICLYNQTDRTWFERRSVRSILTGGISVQTEFNAYKQTDGTVIIGVPRQYFVLVGQDLVVGCTPINTAIVGNLPRKSPGKALSRDVIMRSSPERIHPDKQNHRNTALFAGDELSS